MRAKPFNYQYILSCLRLIKNNIRVFLRETLKSRPCLAAEADQEDKGEMILIEFKHAEKTFNDGTKAVIDFSLQIGKGEFVSLVGPSGCGKTTTLKMINRLLEPTAGSILIEGRPAEAFDRHILRRNIGYVLQQIALFPHMNVEENISVVPLLNNWDKERIRKRSHELMEMIGLAPDAYLKRYPHELSGGQQQRIGIIRALAANPDILLMDEPFSALDPISRKQLQEDIQELQKEIRKTIVFVTHDIKEAAKLSDRICLMNKGQIVQYGTPEELRNQPANDFVRTFFADFEPSAWHHTVKELLAECPMEFSVMQEDLFKPELAEEGNYTVLVSPEGKFAGLAYEGKVMSQAILSPDMTIESAASIMLNQSAAVHPVLINETCCGLVGYSQLLTYLRQKQTGREV